MFHTKHDLRNGPHSGLLISCATTEQLREEAMVRKKCLAAVLALLMILMPVSALVGAEFAPWEGQTHPRPSTPGGAAEITTTGFTLPANGTITDGWLNLSTDWDQPGGNGSGWSSGSETNFSSGQETLTTSHRFEGALSLAQDQSVGTYEDFTTLETTFLEWLPAGPDALLWSPSDLNLSGTNVTVGNDTGLFNSSWGGTIPASSTEGNMVVSTLGLPPSRVPAGAHAWLEGPQVRLPNVIRNYSAQFDHWIHLGGGGGWVEYSLDGGVWKVLSPDGGYPDNLPSASPQLTGFANSSASGWKNSTITLDGLNGIHSADHIRFRFVIWTDANATSTGPGWFIDNLTLENEGEPLACWFHGNLNGAYANDADAWIVFNFSTSNLTVPMEITASLDWDLEGGWNDNLIVEASNDNQTWYEISLPPGIPGVGLIVNGFAYADEAGGWVDITMPLQSIFQNRSNVLLRFRVETDYSLGYGASINGWEGVMVDDVILHANSSAGKVEILLDNFSTNDSVAIGVAPGANEQWQYLTDRGHNGYSTTTFGFESTIDLARGWHLNHERGSRWDIGVTNNVSGWGPGGFPDNGNGAGLALDGEYAANTLTHLETKDWSIPDNASARLVFDNWVCTEANWDGGTIFISDDAGLSWAPFAQQEPGFYDTRSTVNPFSPLYNLMIFDGSSISAGCNVQPWVTKRGNLSAWAGESVRFRFTFFSDTYLEGAGWYIDNVGVEVDWFEAAGKWVSPPIKAGPSGYGSAVIGGEIPPETSVSATVIDSSGTPILGYEERELPLDLQGIRPDLHSTIHIRLDLASDSALRTPILQNLHVGSNLYLTTPVMGSSGWESSATLPVLWDSASDAYVGENSSGKMTAIFSIHRPARSISIWCDCESVYLSLNPEANPSTAYLATQIQQPTSSLLNGLYLRDIQDLKITVDILQNGWVKNLRVEVEYSDIAVNPAVDLKGDGSNEWSHSGPFGIATDVNGTNDHQFYAVNGVTYSKNLGSHNYSQVFDGIARLGIIADLSTVTTISRAGWSTQVTGSNYNVVVPLIDIIPGQSTILEFTVSADASITLYDKAVPFNHLFTIPLAADFLTNISSGLLVNQSTGEFIVPVNLTTESGGFVVGGMIEWQRLFTDVFETPPPATIYPDGNSFTIETYSLHNFEGVIDTVRLSIGTTRDLDSAEVVFVATNTSTPQATLEVVRGVELMSIDTTDWDAGFTENIRRINWNITPTRAWGDQAQLWWMLESSNDESSPLGPTVFSTGGSTGPALEVDLEVTDIVVVNQFGNDIADESDSLYPWSVQDDSNISVSGFVRFQGSPDIAAPAEMFTLNLSLQDEQAGSGSLGEVVTYTEVTTAEGNWSTNITIPGGGDISSGDEMRVVPFLEFSSDESSYGVGDETLVANYPHFIFDSQEPTLGVLYTIPPGIRQPADGHVWYEDNLLALSIEISDDVRQGEALNLHYWVEAADDTNSDGFAQGEEYRMLSEQLSLNSLNQIVDFPLIDVSTAIPEGRSWGEVSLWLSGDDLAGNPLTTGGAPGLGSDSGTGSGVGVGDLATVRITRDSLAEIESGSASFDLVNGQLLAGHKHTFSVILEEQEGLDSLDRLVLDITGEVDGEDCAITWYPWSDESDYPRECFVDESVSIENVELSADRWQIEISFILPWLNSSTFGQSALIPSFAAYDLGQDLGLGYQTMTPFAWQYNGDAEIVVAEMNDLTAPFGQLVDDIFYISSDDLVSVGVLVVHAGTDIPLDLGYGFQIRVAGGINQSTAAGWYAGDGELAYAAMELRYDDFPNLQATLHVEPLALENNSGEIFHTTGESYSVIFDNYAPRLITLPNLHSVHIDRMDYLPVNFDISEPNQMDPESVIVHYSFISADNQTRYSGSALAELASKSGADWNYHATLNLTPSSQLGDGDGMGNTLLNTDTIRLWVEGADYAGNLLKGSGTNESPTFPAFIAPTFTPFLELLSNPEDDVEIGHSIVVESTLVNQGDGRGNATIALFINGVFVDATTVELLPGGVAGFSLEYGTEVLGQHQVKIVLNETGQSENLTLEVVALAPINDSFAAASMAGSGLAMLFVFAAIIIIVRGRNSVLEEYDEDKLFDDFEDFEQE
jgi:hypothetical protein